VQYGQPYLFFPSISVRASAETGGSYRTHHMHLMYLWCCLIVINL